MITLAIAQMVYFVMLQAPFTGALFGLLSLRSDTAMYFLVLVVFVASFLAISPSCIRRLVRL